MAETGTRRGSRGKLAATAAGAVILGVCIIGNDLKTPEGGPPQPAAAQVAPPPAAPPQAPAAAPAPAAPAPAAPAPAAPPPAAPPAVKPMKSVPPLRVRIPAIKVDAPVVGLGLDTKGMLQVPPAADRNLAGWYLDGPGPGARGAAIMLGHVDTMTGPAVFWNLGSLVKGDKIEIDRSDGKTATFEIDTVESFEKSAFPDKRVYGETQDAQLRLITCGGVYDKKRKDYLSNVVAFAHLVSTS